MAGAGNGLVPALLYVPRLRALFPSTPVESRVGESHTEGSCWVAEFICGVREKDPNYLSACKNLPEYQETSYCVLHFPGEEKEDFEQVKKNKLEQEDYDFSGTVFPKGTSDFSRFVFDGNAVFTGATFIGEADFSDAQFSGERTSFQVAQFSGENIYFVGAHFSNESTYFEGAQFGSAETSFQEATFAKGVYFGGVTFSEKVTFWGTQGNRVFGPGARAKFDRSRIEKPEQVTFNTVLLHPGWFINADVRKVDFTDVQWYGMPGGQEGRIEAEVTALEERGVESPYTLLSQACRRLSANAEENREYPLANEFYYWSMNSLRKQGWRSLGAIGTLYWALSGYGVRATRAFLVLVGICAAFAALYLGFGPPKLEDLGQALVYSLGAVARLNPEPRPTEPGVFQFLVILEGLLGPLQIALLALAVRRKVMR